MILHADANSFYASCEQIFRPDLRNKPVIVLSNNDGIIVALNKEAKACGLQRGDPYFKVTALITLHKVSVFSSNYTLYADISNRINSIYMEYAPIIEEYSIDESFLFFDDCNLSVNDFYEVGIELKRRVNKEVGIPICVGAAPTKTLAKLCNKLAKENGGVYVYRADTFDDVLRGLPCEKIWGIGSRKARTLSRYGIKTAYQLKTMPLYTAKKLLTIQGFATVQELNGIQSIDRIERTAKRMITSSKQFSVYVYDEETMKGAIVEYAKLAVERLIKQKSLCSGVSVFISTCNYFCADESQKYSNGTSVRLMHATNYLPEIVKAAELGLHTIYRGGYAYKSVMISLQELSSQNGQYELWDTQEKAKKESIMSAVCDIQAKYGRDCITLAQGKTQDVWHTKHDFLSKSYTTNPAAFPFVH